MGGPRPDRGILDPFVDELARLAAAGSPTALELLIEAIDTWRLAQPGVRRILVDESEVDDALQDVLVAVAETIQQFRSESRFTTWLHRVARHKAIARLRQRPKAEGSLLAPIPGDAQRISSAIATQVSVAAAVAELSDRYREAVILRDVEGLAYAEVAVRLALPLNTARSRIVRGRALVAARLASTP